MIDGLSVFGAGRYIEATNIQRFVVATEEGDDEIYLLSASPYCTTVVTGGLGSDKVFITNAETPTVVAKTLLGQSGVIDNYVENLNHEDWNVSMGIVDGVHTYVADSDTASLFLEVQGDILGKVAGTVVFDNPDIASLVPLKYKEFVYTMRLTKATGNKTVLARINIPAATAESQDVLMFESNYPDNIVTFDCGNTGDVKTVILRPNPEAFQLLQPHLQNHAERYITITHTIMSGNLRRRQRDDRTMQERSRRALQFQFDSPRR